MSCSNNDTLPSRFWAKVLKTNDCWLWTGGSDSSGYGAIKTAKGMSIASRVSFELSVGSIPEGQCVLHRCDNPKCVKPDHLFLGTVGDNNRDRHRKGRTRASSGELHGISKLSDAGVRIIRCSPLSTKELAAIFCVSKDAINSARNNKTWKHI